MIVDKIKDENIVVNLSNQTIPDAGYIFLQKGLGFVPSHKVDIQDFKYDTLEFIRKLEWRAIFEANPELQLNNEHKLHEDIRISSFTHPQFSHPILTKRNSLVGLPITNQQSRNITSLLLK